MRLGRIAGRIEVVGRSQVAEDGTRRWPCTISSEVPVNRRDQFGQPFTEVLSHAPGAVDLSRAPLPVLEGHDQARVNIGLIDDLRVDADRLRGQLVLGSSPRARELGPDIDAGIVSGLSVGYEILEPQRSDDGKTVTAMLWRPYECSIVGVPADDTVGINRSSGMRADGQDDDKDKDREGDMSEAEGAARKARLAAKRAKRREEDAELRLKREEEDRSDSDEEDDDDSDPAPDSGDDKGDDKGRAVVIPLAKRVAAESQRSGEIRRRCKAAGLGRVFAQSLIDEGVKIADLPKEIRKAQSVHDDGVGAQVMTRSFEAGEDVRDKFARGAMASILHRSAAAALVGDVQRMAAKGQILNLDGKPARVDERTRAYLAQPIDFDPGEYRSFSLLDLGARSLELRGVRDTRRMGKTALAHASLVRSMGDLSQFVRDIGGMNTTSDYPLLLENVLHKVLLSQYAITPDTWSMFCRTGSVVDFRPHPRYRLGSFGALKPLTEAGEFVNQTIPDGEKQTISATPKGAMIAISRQTLINDDLSAFNQLATMLGRQAKLSVEMDVYATLALNSGNGPALFDGNSLFHASHNNITNQAAISVVALDADRVAMKTQKDPSGNELLDLVPYILVVPASLGGIARTINNNVYDTDGTSGFKGNAFMVSNRVQGLFKEVVDTARLLGTQRYLFADPGIAPCLEVAFLEGQQAPFLEWVLGHRTDGIEWKIRLDWGVAGVDFRGAITNAG